MERGLYRDPDDDMQDHLVAAAVDTPEGDESNDDDDDDSPVGVGRCYIKIDSGPYFLASTYAP